jgi:hypothetical protein
MFSPIARWFALSALLFLGATVTPASLQGQQSTAADRSSTAAQTSTVIASPATATVIDPPLPLSDPLLVPFGITVPVPASPFAIGMAPKQDDGVHLGSNLALMGVGAAGLVVGLIMNNDTGTIIAVGGGAVFLIGFYRWLS